MTSKERAAMQQALEALEALENYGIDGTKSVGGIKCTEAITALREALDHFRDATKMVAMNLNCKSVQKRLATSWGYVLAEQADQEPVAWFVQYKNRHEFVFGSKPKYIVDGVVEPLYAAPVRTKDLTDDEIRAMFNGYVAPEILLMFRAVIAAYKEKNK